MILAYKKRRYGANGCANVSEFGRFGPFYGIAREREIERETTEFSLLDEESIISYTPAWLLEHCACDLEATHKMEQKNNSESDKLMNVGLELFISIARG